jgi:hypothetical protein
MGMSNRWGIAGALALALTLSASAVAQGAAYQQRHEISVDPGPAGAAAVVTIGNGPGGPQDLRTGHELRLRGVPQPPRAAAPQPPGVPGDPKLTLPNLAPLPPFDVFVGPAEQPSGPVWSNLGSLGGGGYVASSALRFTTTIQNRGAHSFELVGTPWQPDSAHEDLLTTQAYQCVRFFGLGVSGATRNCGEYRHVGSLTWHAQHRHFHINGFGRYELRRDAGGKPDMSPNGVVGRAQKLGWCVSDMYNWREDATPGPAGQASDTAQEPYERAWYQECTNAVLYTGASWRQGISPGWADTYPAMYTGQEIPLKGVADGRYWIVTTINPKDNEYGLKIAETTWADNASASLVEIYAGGKKAKLIAPMPAKPYGDWFENPEGQPGN